MKTKYCNACKETKDVAAFAKNKAAASGYQSRCKACMKALYKPKKRQLIKVDGVTGNYKKPSYDRDELINQIRKLQTRESTPETSSNFDYNFLKFIK